MGMSLQYPFTVYAKDGKNHQKIMEALSGPALVEDQGNRILVTPVIGQPIPFDYLKSIFGGVSRISSSFYPDGLGNMVREAIKRDQDAAAKNAPFIR